MSKELDNWISQAAEYGIASCNVSHDINNVLAILMGYAENLEYMLEIDKVDKQELQEICDKFFYAIDKLNAKSRDVATKRKQNAQVETNQDLSAYFEKWLKIQMPQFKEKQISISFTKSDEFLIQQDWSQVYIGLCELFCHLLSKSNLQDPTKLEVQTQLNEKGFNILLNPVNFLNTESLPKFLGHPVELSLVAENLCLHFPCFSEANRNKTAA